MAILSGLGAWLRRLFGASRPSERPGGARSLGDLLSAPAPIEIASATIEEHVARLVIREPLPDPVDEFVERRLLEAAWGTVRAHPAEGPIRAFEVWAPPEAGRAPVRTLRREFAAPLEVPPSPPSRAGPAHPEPHFTALGERPYSGPEPPEAADTGMRPLTEFLSIPEHLQVRLAARGIDQGALALDRLVEALLAEAGYTASRREEQGRVVDLDATSGAGRVVVRCYRSDGHVMAATVDRFSFTFLSSGAEEGFFITDGLLPFESRKRWERDPRIHLLDRVGLQRFIDAVAGRTGSAPPAPGPSV